MTGFTPIKYDSELYTEAVELRHNFLHRPLGLSLDEESLTKERYFWHFAWLKQERLIAYAQIEGANDIVHLRQMIVHPDYQRQKIGKMLLCKIEDFMISKGTARIELNAQEQALGFYKKLNYEEIDGQVFSMVGIPHIKMFRNLLCSSC